jgi:hypothetical protein
MTPPNLQAKDVGQSGEIFDVTLKVMDWRAGIVYHDLLLISLDVDNFQVIEGDWPLVAAVQSETDGYDFAQLEFSTRLGEAMTRESVGRKHRLHQIRFSLGDIEGMPVKGPGESSDVIDVYPRNGSLGGSVANGASSAALRMLAGRCYAAIPKIVWMNWR